jgi:hypothetical protein
MRLPNKSFCGRCGVSRVHQRNRDTESVNTSYEGKIDVEPWNCYLHNSSMASTASKIAPLVRSWTACSSAISIRQVGEESGKVFSNFDGVLEKIACKAGTFPKS